MLQKEEEEEEEEKGEGEDQKDADGVWWPTPAISALGRRRQQDPRLKSYPWLHSILKEKLEYMKPCLKTQSKYMNL